MVDRQFLEANDVDEQTIQNLLDEPAAPSLPEGLPDFPTWDASSLEDYHLGNKYYDQPASWGDLTPYAALDESLQDMIDAAHLRVDSGFDRHYTTPSGTYDADRAEIDNWLVRFERVYHENRGQLPEDFLVDIGEDLALFEGQPEILQEIARFGAWGAHYENMRQQQEAAALSRTDRFMQLYQVGKDEADRIIRSVDQAYAQIDAVANAVQSIEDVEAAGIGWRFDGHEFFQDENGKFIGHGGKTFDTKEEAFIDSGRFWIAQSETEKWNESLPKTPTGSSWGDALNGVFGFGDGKPFGELFALSGEQGALDVDKGIDESFLGQMTNEAYFALGVLGDSIGTGADLFGFLTDQAANAGGWVFFGDWDTADDSGAKLGRWVEENLNEAAVIENRNELRRQAERTLGMSDQEQVMAAAMFTIPEVWASMPTVDPEGYQLMLDMAGGDEQTAFQMWAEEMTFGEQNYEFFKEQARLQQELAATTIKELDNNNYDLGDALLDVLGIWGEAMENAATAVTIGGQMLWDAVHSEDRQEDRSFAERYRDSGGTVSGALGVDGTLTGLGVDLLFPALVDPTTWIFGPKLARKGRTGITVEAQIDQVVNSPISQASLDGLNGVINSGHRSTKGIVTMISELGTTGNAGSMLRAMNGWVDELPGTHAWKEAPNAHLVDEMSLDTLVDLIPEEARGALPGGVVDELADRLMDPARPNLSADEIAVIKYNPTTGQLDLVSGHEGVLAMKKVNQRSVPTRIEVDPDYGITRRIPSAEDVADAVAPNGTMMLGELEEIAQLDFGKANIPAEDAAKVQGMVEHIQDVGVDQAMRDFGMGDTPMEVLFMPDDGTLLLADGNHRIAALRAAGADLPVQVKVTVPAADEIATFRAVLDDPLPELADVYKDPVRRPDLMEEFGPRSEFARNIDPEQLLEFDGVQHVKPSQFFERKHLYGEVDMDHARAVLKRHYELGGDAPHGHRTLLNIKAANALRADMARLSKPGRWLDRHMTGMNNLPTVSFNQANSSTVITQTMLRHHQLLGGAVDEALPFINRVNRHYTEIADLEFQANQLTARVRALEAKKAALADAGKVPDNALTYPGRQPNPLSSIDDDAVRFDTPYGDKAATRMAMAENRAAVRQGVQALDAEIAAAKASQKELAGKLNNHQPLKDILSEYEKDLNRRYLATSPKIREEMARRGVKLNPDGTVPNNFLQVNKGNTIIQRTVERLKSSDDVVFQLRKAAGEFEEAGMPASAAKIKALEEAFEGLDEMTLDTVDRFAKDVLHSMHSPSDYHWNLTPLEYMAAAEKGIPYLRKVQQRQAMQSLNEMAHKLHNAWMLDKVLTPQTGIKVSMDELYRMHNQGGYKFLYDSVADRLAIRLRRQRWLRSQDNAFSSAVNKRLQVLEEYPAYFRQAERQLLDGNGVGFDTIEFNKNHGQRSLRNIEYYEAANRTAGQMLTDEGFQKFLEGPDSFRAWFADDTKSQYLRNTEIHFPETGGSRLLETADEAMDIYAQYFEGYALRNIKSSKKAQARKAWSEAAQRQATRGGVRGGAMALPEWVLEGFGEVYGKKKHGLLGEAVGPVGRLGDRVFQRPVNYRRGRLAEMVRSAEWNRLRSLYADMAVDIVPEEKILQMARQRYPEMGEHVFVRYRDRIHQDLLRHENIISERYLHNLVEQKVILEMENTLYNFNISSQFTKGSKWVAPFGKPYYDMMSHWGREITSRGNLRPALSKLDAQQFGGLGQKIVDATPFNPRTAARLSRLAATDFDLENMEDDPFLGSLWKHFFGEADLDVSGFMFLPTQNVQPAQVMLPGLGLGPTWGMSWLFEQSGPDPLEDPVGWEQHYSRWADFLPGLAQNNAGDALDNLVSSVVGGGALDKGSTGLRLLAAWFKSGPDDNPDALRNSSTWNSRVNQTLRASMADGAFWDEIMSMSSEGVAWDDQRQAMVQSMISDLVAEATGISTAERAKEFGLEYFTPGRTTPTMVGDEVAQIWTDNVVALGLDPNDFDMSSEDGRNRAARDISNYYWSLDPALRDILAIENPEIIVNTVSGWQWSRKGESSDAVDTSSPYRYDVSDDGARHRILQREGLIEAIEGPDMVNTAVAQRFAIEKRLYTYIWEEQADSVNPLVWEQLVDDEWKAWFQGVYDTGIAEGFFKGLYDSPMDMWNDWTGKNGAAQILFDNDYVAAREDADGNQELVPLSIPDKIKAWSTTDPGNSERLSDKFAELPLTGWANEQVQRAAEALGLDLPLDGTHTFGDLFLSLQELDKALSTNEAYVATLAQYDARNATRGGDARAAQKIVDQYMNEMPPEYKADVREWQRLNVKAMELQRVGDDDWIEFKRKADALASQFLDDDMMNPAPWNKIHEDLYGRTLGSIDWQAPEPAPLFTEDGISPKAQLVIPRGVVDGDTLNFSTSRQGLLPFQDHVPDAYSVRLLGINAPELSQDGGMAAKIRLEQAIEDAIANNQLIYLVTDDRKPRSVDSYGRRLAWLYINGEVYHDPATITPRG